MYTLSLSLSHTHTHMLSLSHMHTHTPPPSLTHTHTHNALQNYGSVTFDPDWCHTWREVCCMYTCRLDQTWLSVRCLTSPSLQTHHLSDITIAPNTSLWHHHRSKHIISLTSPSLQTHHLSDITIAPNTSSLWHHHRSKHIISQPWVLQISFCQSSSNFKNDVRWLPIVLPAEQSMVCSHLGMGKCKCSEKLETRITASTLKQDPHTRKVKKDSIFCD